MPLDAPLHDFTKTVSFFLVHSPDILNIVHCEHPFFPPQVVRQPENIGLMGGSQWTLLSMPTVTLLDCVSLHFYYALNTDARMGE